ncbi:MAG: Snf7 family protein [Candidatus Geothermarchaeales archaeon]
MSKFIEVWTGKKGVQKRLKETLRPEREFRYKLNKVMRLLDRQRMKLETAAASLTRKDDYFFRRVVGALRKHDRRRAVIYANEMAEVRKIIKDINQARLALEQISVRLSTVRDVGDIAVTLAPALSLVRSIRGNVSNVIPQAEKEYDNILDLMSSVVADSARIGGVTLDFSTTNLEAENIIRNAEKRVEREMRERLPPVPTEDLKI